MKLDEIEIGARIRKIREEDFKESRQTFAEKCGITENHLGKLERGQFLITTKLLNIICTVSGVDTDYILYGNENKKETTVRDKIERFLDNSSKEELKMYFKIISSINECK